MFCQKEAFSTWWLKANLNRINFFSISSAWVLIVLSLLKDGTSVLSKDTKDNVLLSMGSYNTFAVSFYSGALRGFPTSPPKGKLLCKIAAGSDSTSMKDS